MNSDGMCCFNILSDCNVQLGVEIMKQLYASCIVVYAAVAISACMVCVCLKTCTYVASYSHLFIMYSVV